MRNRPKDEARQEKSGWLANAAATLALPGFILLLVFLFGKYSDRQVGAQRPLAETARRLLPVMEEQAMARAAYLSGSAKPELVSQSIEYPSIRYTFYSPEPGKLEKVLDAAQHANLICIAENESALYHGGADDPAELYVDEDFFDNYDNIARHPNVDISKVKTIIVVLLRAAETKVYEEVAPEKGGAISETTISRQVFVVNRESMNVIAYKSFQPEKLPNVYEGNDGGSCAINERTEAAQVSWLNSLDAANLK